MDQGPSDVSWSDAARAAESAWYAPRSPDLQDLWAGGFGFGPDGPSHLETCALIGGIEVSVNTWSGQERPPGGFELRNLLHGLTFHYLFEEVHDVPLPFSIEFVADNRTISIDGHALVFDGVRISSSTRWIGSARLPGATLQVTVAAAVPDFELVSSNDVYLPELPSR